MKPEQHMLRAIELSRRGYPAPNPRVGCVIVKDGERVGEGWHSHAGGDHAEIAALKSAGSQAQGADVFVSLEPCNHTGRTPPCAEALIQARVRSVFLACRDPNPIAAGGKDRLQAAGVAVTAGLLEEKAREANEIFMTAMERKRPYVVGKVAMTLDGRVAARDARSRWITSAAARRIGHKLRAECGGVLVGSGTVMADDPLLTARIPGVVNQPARVLLDPKNCLTGSERVFGPEAPTWHFVGSKQNDRQYEAPMRGSEVDLHALLYKLFEMGLTGLLVEGGPRTLSRFLKAGFVDRLELFIAPMALGSGPAWFESEFESLDQALGFAVQRRRQVGPDLWLTLKPRNV